MGKGGRKGDVRSLGAEVAEGTDCYVFCTGALVEVGFASHEGGAVGAGG